MKLQRNKTTSGLNYPTSYYKADGSFVGVGESGTFNVTPTGATRFKPTPTARINLNPNPHLSATGIANWSSEGANVVNRGRQTDFGHLFSTSYKIDWTQKSSWGIRTFDRFNDPINILPNTNYVYSVWVYVSDFSSLYLTGQARGNDGVDKATPTGPIFEVQPRTWTRLQRVFNTGSDWEQMRTLAVRSAGQQTNAETGSMWVTEVQFELGSEATDYISGDTGQYWWHPVSGAIETIPTNYTLGVDKLMFWLEEETTNLIRNPRMALNTTGWGSHGVGTGVTATLTRAVGGGWNGYDRLMHSGSIVNGNGTSTLVTMTMADIPVTAGQVYTMSGYLQSSVATMARFEVYWYDSGGTGLGVTDTGSTVPIIPNTYPKEVVHTTNAAPANAASVRVIVRFFQAVAGSYSFSCFGTAFQFEAKSYKSSYCDGSLGNGYAWSGTAHNSASTRSTTYLGFPYRSEKNGTLLVRARTRPVLRESTVQYLVNVTGTINGPAIGYYAPNDSFLGGYASSINANSTPVLTTDTDYVMEISWKDNGSSTYDVFVNNVQHRDDWAVTTPPTYGNPLTMYVRGNEYLDAYEIMYFNREITTQERTKLHLSPEWSFDILARGAKTISRDRNQAQVVRSARVLPKVSRVHSISAKVGRSEITLPSPALVNDDANGTITYKDRLGQGVLTTSGPVRYQPGPGARINLIANPRAANNLNGVSGTGLATIERVVDNSFNEGTAIEVVTAASNTSGITQTHATGIAPFDPSINSTLTFSFDAKVVSGSPEYRVIFKEYNRAGNEIGGSATDTFTFEDGVQRYSTTYTPTASGVSYVRTQVRRTVDTVGTFRISNMVIEYGDVSDPSYFEGVWLNRETGYLGTAHNSPSCDRVARWLEPATTNLFTNPSFETNTVGWTANGTGSISRDTTTAYIGSASLKVVTSDAPTAGVKSSIMSVLGATTYTVSFWAKGDSADLGDLRLNGVVYQLTGNWERYSYTYTTDPGQTTMPFYIGTHTGRVTTFWIDGVQLEQRSSATAYCDGSLGFGHSWIGTPNASTSNRTAATLQFPTTNHILPDTGSATMWFNMATTLTGTLFLAGSALTGAYLEMYMGPIGISMIARDDGTLTTGTTTWSPDALAINTWHFGYVEWSPTHIGYATNNSAVVTRARTYSGVPFANGSFVQFGNWNGGRSYSNVHIFDRPLTTEERTALYTGKAGAFPFKQPTKILRTQGD